MLFLLTADHFLAPPDCAFYWAWAEAPARSGTFAFSPVYERLRMPTLYVWVTPAARLANDWPMGTGVALLPAVRLGPAAAHAWVALWVVAALSLWWRAAPFSRASRTAGAVALVLGTPVLFYAAFGPFFSHSVSFAGVTAFLVAWDRTRGGRTRHEWLLLGLLLGFTALVRLPNVLLGLVFAAELPGWIRGSRPGRPRLQDLLLFAGGAFLAFSPQMLSWWTIYGNPLALPKLDEMHWLRPYLAELLFSDYHGLIPWTPVYALAALGLLYLGRRDPVAAAGFALVLAAQVYVNAANLVWWSGGSFGNRRLSDSAIVVAYAVAALREVQTGRRGRWAVGAALVLSCAWTGTLLLAERRLLVPLDRYVPFLRPEFAGNLLRTWTELPETFRALTRPLALSAGSGFGGSTGLAARLGASAVVAGGTAVLIALTGCLDRRHARRLVVPLGFVISCLALGTAVVGLATPRLRPAEIEGARRASGILWDNYIELGAYQLVRGHPAEAEQTALRARRIRPGHYLNDWILGTALRDQGRYLEAAAAYEQVLRSNQFHPGARQELQRALARARTRDSAPAESAPGPGR